MDLRIVRSEAVDARDRKLPPATVLCWPSTSAKLVDDRHVLVALTEQRPELEFFGSVVTLDDLAKGAPSFAGKTVYLTGDISKLGELAPNDAARILVIEELSRGYGTDAELGLLERLRGGWS